MQTDSSVIRRTTGVDPSYGSIGTPLYLTSNFRFREPGVSTGYDYTRSGNPTRTALEDALATLEHGARAVAVGSGMAAIATVLADLPAGAHVVCTHDCYGGTARLLSLYAAQGKIAVSFVDLADTGRAADAITPATRCLWIETPSNPLLAVVDIPRLVAIAHRRDILVCVDNTLLSPAHCSPLELGADLVVHSTTKWIAGHSDVIGGAIIARTAEHGERFAWLANALGTTAAPFDSWLVLRGAKTLSVRMARHQENAFAVARALAGNAHVAEVFYPGLASHASHAVAARLFHGFGGVVTFRVRGDRDAVRRVLGSTEIFSLAESLGGVESLIEHPATMSHASMTQAQREAAGITDDLIRVSVGLEHPDDLVADLEQALAAADAPAIESVPATVKVVTRGIRAQEVVE